MYVITEGQLRGGIRGFRDRNTFFEFTSGPVWRQAEYKYHYQCLYMPVPKSSMVPREPRSKSTASTKRYESSELDRDGHPRASMLADKDDAHSIKVFDPSIKGKTDRFAYRFVRP
jgi:hypothetical protein